VSTALLAWGCLGTTVVETATPQQIVGRLLVGLSASDPTVPCDWLVLPDGRRVEVLYPDGWSVEGDPAALRAPDGTEVAFEGDLVAADGVEARLGDSLCGGDLLFEAHTIAQR
jgi:hypothetical protein